MLCTYLFQQSFINIEPFITKLNSYSYVTKIRTFENIGIREVGKLAFIIDCLFNFECTFHKGYIFN